MKTLNFLIFCMMLIAFTSCAILFSGTKTNVKVDGTPPNASVYYNGNYEGTAPCQVKVNKKALKDGNAKIQVKAENHIDSEVTLTRKLKTGAMIGNFITFPVGHIIDFVTGAIYKPYPAKVEYNLKEK